MQYNTVHAHREDTCKEKSTLVYTFRIPCHFCGWSLHSVLSLICRQYNIYNYGPVIIIKHKNIVLD